MKKKIILSIILAISSFLILLSFYKTYSKKKLDPYCIAVAAPFSGEGKLIGKSIIQGISLYIEKINSEGGIDNRKIKLIKYDDNNDPKMAEKAAYDISKNDEILAVIGHWFSSCSINAGMIYKKNKICAITPGSTNIKVTRFNNWYFRTVFNDNLQGRFLANYAKKVLKQNFVNIIYENDPYGSYLAMTFEAKAKQLGIKINFIQSFDSNGNLDKTHKNIFNKLKHNIEINKDNSGLIFIAAHATKGIGLIKLIKDSGISNPIMVPDSFGSRTFQNGFDKYKKEKENPGFYTNGIYVTTHLIFDTANEKAQKFKNAYRNKYKENPDWIATYSYDTAMVLSNAILKSEFEKNNYNIFEKRKKIKDSLEAVNSPKNALEGVTGLIYFNEKGDAVGKPVSIGVYKRKKIISALTQLQAIKNINLVPDIEKEYKNERILKIDGNYMYRTNVVYTGIELIEISKFDPEEMSSILDFYLWFRYPGDIHFQPQDIEFLNAIDPVLHIDNSSDSLKENSKQSNNFITMTKEDYLVSKDMIKYLLFRVKGKFKADYFASKTTFDQYKPGISFRHKTLNKNNLVYVIDSLGMPLTNELYSENKYISKIASKLTGWSIADKVCYQDIIERTTIASLKSSIKYNKGFEYSRFNYWVEIKKNELTLRGIIPKNYVNDLLIISISILVILILIDKQKAFKNFLRSIWFFQSICYLIILLSSEIFLIDLLEKKLSIYHLKLIKITFDILWWIVPAFLISLAFKRFLFIPLERKSGHKIPGIIRHFLSFIIYLIAFIGIIAFVYEHEISKILATGGLFAMIIGFAIQMNISNLISGIAINLENPFRIGDWVKIGNSQGKVVDITWRSTRIETEENCILSIPNSTATESFISNFNYPDDLNWLNLRVRIYPIYNPKNVKKILNDAVLSANNVLTEPEPVVIFSGLSQWSADYTVKFCIKDYANKDIDLQFVWNRVWLHLRYAQIEIAIFEQEKPPEIPQRTFSILNEMNIFKSLSEDETKNLYEKMNVVSFKKQDIIIQEGSYGDSIYLIKEGVVQIIIEFENNDKLEINRLGVGEFIGEMGLLTGEIRKASVIAKTDTIVYEIPKNDISLYIQNHQEIMDVLEKTFSNRLEKIKKQKALHTESVQENQKLKKRFFYKIWSFFTHKNLDK